MPGSKTVENTPKSRFEGKKRADGAESPTKSTKELAEKYNN
jgi:hypothetical protein